MALSGFLVFIIASLIMAFSLIIAFICFTIAKVISLFIDSKNKINLK